jgi:hypothetical protein
MGIYCIHQRHRCNIWCKEGGMDKFKMIDVMEALDIPRERFKDWLMRGYITASIYIEKGKRTFKHYSRLDIYRIALFKHLVQSVRVPREVAAGLSLVLHGENVEKNYICFLAPKKDDLRYEFISFEIVKDIPKLIKPERWSHMIIIPWGAIRDNVDNILKKRS